jgi:hypothetical protein
MLYAWDIEKSDFKLIVLGSCISVFCTHWVRRYQFDKKAVAYLKEVDRLSGKP